MCNLSYSHFAKLFREHFGQSCKEYITYIRLNKADELLMHTNYDISYIATETGFFDGSHFIHAYKKWKGITPKQRRLLLTASKSCYNMCRIVIFKLYIRNIKFLNVVTSILFV